MRGIGDILSKLGTVKKLGNGEYATRCPAHDDKNPSLNLRQEGDKILVKCQAGCTTESVMAALGLKMTDLFLGDKPKVIPPKIIKTYDYKDEAGNLLYQVVRFDPKGFKQRHRNGDGEWTWDMKGVRRILYRLPEILTTDKTVLVVEGEKDADNLWDCDQVATTSPGGASAWKPEYADYLKGKNVVVIPDKDNAGWKYAQDIVRSLEGKAASVKCIVLPGDTVKDATDWLMAGGDVAELPGMVEDVSVLSDKTDKQGNILTFLTNSPNADKSDRNDKFDKTDFQASRGKIIWGLVDQWLPQHQGERFNLDTICRQLDMKQRDDRHHVVKKLSYEVEHEKLEKTDRLYRYVNKAFVSIDWVNASPAPPLVLKWPYGIEDGTHFGFDGKVVISPGDIIVVAGVSNMGKTAWCLNLLWNNMDAYPCTLMGNEYEAGKFKRRVSRMTWADPMCDDGAPKFELIERYENWKDIIRPNNINIIDWITMSDNFYGIGSIIEGIRSKLKNGIAVISLQKSDSKSLGLGGGFSLQMASLYLAIDFERLTVVKAKEWYEGNPNGKMYGFQIENSGTRFTNIREVKKCYKCGGTGKFRFEECSICMGKGALDL